MTEVTKFSSIKMSGTGNRYYFYMDSYIEIRLVDENFDIKPDENGIIAYNETKTSLINEEPVIY